MNQGPSRRPLVLSPWKGLRADTPSPRRVPPSAPALSLAFQSTEGCYGPPSVPLTLQFLLTASWSLDFRLASREIQRGQ